MGAGSSLAPEPGGAVMVSYPNGDIGRGEVVEIVPGRRLVFSWGYEDDAHGIAPGTTRVVIDLTAIESGTLVTLRHEGLRAAEERRGHLAGWRHYLAALAGAASADALEPHVAPALEAYFAAWSEADAARRTAALARSVVDDVIFRDAMGYVEGRDALGEYIGNAQRFAPGVRLERNGGHARSHEMVLVPWRMVMADGQTLMTGHNVGELAPEGRFRSVVGFRAAPS